MRRVRCVRKEPETRATPYYVAARTPLAYFKVKSNTGPHGIDEQTTRSLRKGIGQIVGLLFISVSLAYITNLGAAAQTCARMRSSSAPAVSRPEISYRQLPMPNVGSEAVVPHPITIADTLALRIPSSPQIAPDGTHIAYVVTESRVKTNEDRSVLYVVSASLPSSPLVLASGVHISGVRWSPDGRTIFFVLETKNGNQLWRVHLGGGGLEQLTHVKGRLAHFWEPTALDFTNSYQLSPDGSYLVYAVYDIGGARREQARQAEGGFVYRGADLVQALTDIRFWRVPFELWSLQAAKRSAHKLWTTRMFRSMGTADPEFLISPDGKQVALLYQTDDDSRYTLAMLDLASKSVRPLLTTLGYSLGLRWADAGRALTFYSEGEVKPGNRRYEQNLYKYKLSDGALEPAATTSSAEALHFANKSEMGARIAEMIETQYGDIVSDCSIDAKSSRAACIRQTPMVPPDVVTIELKDGVPKESPRRLTRVNPQYDVIQLGQVSKLTWPNKWGEGSAGLILPVGYTSGKRYPLVVMLYNLYGGRRFIAAAPGFSNYPAQAFAGKGYAVLLMNISRTTFDYPFGDFEKAKAREVDGVVDDVRSAIDVLIHNGIADTARMGIMGWSYGAFWTDYIITHFPAWFQAAASGEGGNHDTGEYWREDDEWRQQERNFFGGGPYGNYYARWKEVAPNLNMDRLCAPLLLEYSSNYWNGLELYNAIAEQGGQAELVLYLDDDHVLFRPLNIYNSMTRLYDWFNFWLLGEEDPDPAKQAQYERWRGLRKMQEENEKKAAVL